MPGERSKESTETFKRGDRGRETRSLQKQLTEEARQSRDDGSEHPDGAAGGQEEVVEDRGPPVLPELDSIPLSRRMIYGRGRNIMNPRLHPELLEEMGVRLSRGATRGREKKRENLQDL